MKKKITVFLVLVMALMLLAGCGSEKTIKTDEGKVSIGEDKLTFEGKDGSKTEMNVADGKGEKVALPDGYPKDLLPIVDDSKIIMANKNEADGKATYLISFTCSKKAKDVNEYYKGVLKDTTDLNTSQINEVYTLTGYKGDQQLTVWITQEEKDTSVNLGISPKQ